MNRIPISLLLTAIIVVALLGLLMIPDSGTHGSPQRVQTSESTRAGMQDDFCLDGCPLGVTSHDQLVVHHIFELENNPVTKFADWVAYKITPQTLGKGCKRIWKADPDLDADATLTPEDYRGLRQALQSDRGHQAPLASLCGSPYWDEADYLSNITPQKTDLNEGEWERLEDAERRLVTTHVSDTVYSLTGPLYERAMQDLPNATRTHRVPSGYWKLVSVEVRGKTMAAAFIMDQNALRDADFCRSSVSLAALQARTHLTFFPKISPDEASRLPASSAEMLSALGC